MRALPSLFSGEPTTGSAVCADSRVNCLFDQIKYAAVCHASASRYCLPRDLRVPMNHIIGCLCAALLVAASAARAADPAAPAASDAAVDQLESNPMRVDRISFRGESALPLSALQAVAAPYVGRDLSAADIENLRAALTHLYTDAGYINSSVVLDPNAPYHDRVLSFLVIE